MDCSNKIMNNKPSFDEGKWWNILNEFPRSLVVISLDCNHNIFLPYLLRDDHLTSLLHSNAFTTRLTRLSQQKNSCGNKTLLHCVVVQ